MTKMKQSAQLHDLPLYWQERIRQFRVENAKLRRERNQLREELAELR
jgi:hypothetical protein